MPVLSETQDIVYGISGDFGYGGSIYAFDFHGFGIFLPFLFSTHFSTLFYTNFMSLFLPDFSGFINIKLRENHVVYPFRKKFYHLLPRTRTNRS